VARSEFQLFDIPTQKYPDRSHGGRVLAAALEKYARRDDVTVLALPRGGVPVAYEIAKHLQVPLDVFIVRKLGLPGHEEFVVGAIASGGVTILNDDMFGGFSISDTVMGKVVAREREELSQRETAYRGDRPPLDVRGRTIIVVDDGLATGSTMKAAIEGLRRLDPRRIVVATPIAAASTCEELSPLVDEIVCARTPEDFHAVGLWYSDFTQTSDDEVRRILSVAAVEQAQTAGKVGEPLAEDEHGTDL
jgi:predicted phosphoribosyltransferase